MAPTRLVKHQTALDRFIRFLSSLKCGLILLGLVGAAVIIGTVVLQRPMAREGQIEQLYAPQTIHLLNALDSSMFSTPNGSSCCWPCWGPILRWHRSIASRRSGASS